MSFYSLSFPVAKSALYICYKNDGDADEVLQEKVQSKESLGYQTSVLKLHTKFNPAKQIRTFLQREHPKGVDYLYFKQPSNQFSTSENIQGFARETLIKICDAVKDRGILEIDSNGRGLGVRDLMQFCLPSVIVKQTIRYDEETQARMVRAIESKDIEQIKSYCEMDNLFEQVLLSSAVSTQMVSDLFMTVIQACEKNEDEEWGGFLGPDFGEDPWLDEIIERILRNCQMPQHVLDEALQDSAKHGCAKIVSKILSAGNISPDALGRALTLSVANGWVEVVELLLKAPNAKAISEGHLKIALADAVVWLPSGGFVARDICDLLLKTRIISKEGLREVQGQMQNLNDCDAVEFLEKKIKQVDGVLGKANESWSLSSSSHF